MYLKKIKFNTPNYLRFLSYLMRDLMLDHTLAIRSVFLKVGDIAPLCALGDFKGTAEDPKIISGR